MNHSIPYLDFSSTVVTPKKCHKQYADIVAAVSDLNLSLPRSRALSVDVFVFEGGYDVCISQRDIILFTSSTAMYPSFIRRCFTQVTL
jgi:hypothetical protein